MRNIERIQQSEARPTIDNLLALGDLAMQAARIDRAVAYPDGRRENDAEHSFMLSLVARSLATQFCPKLDANKVAWYATVHDLLEVYTGDADTLTASTEVYAQKEAAERAALERFRADYADTWPSLVEAVEAYESQIEPEARFVKVIDKILPALCEIRDGGQRLRERGIHTVEDHRASVHITDVRLARIADDQTLALQLRQDAIQAVRTRVFGEAQAIS